jgi:hypothetical protein
VILLDFMRLAIQRFCAWFYAWGRFFLNLSAGFAVTNIPLAVVVFGAAGSGRKCLLDSAQDSEDAGQD